MATRIRSSLASLIAAMVTASALEAVASQAAPAASAQRKVVILATGGTIAGVQPKEGEPGYKAGSLSIDALIKGAPGMRSLPGSTASRSRTSAART